MKIIIQNIRDFLLRKKRKGKKLLFLEKIGDRNSTRDEIKQNLIKVLNYTLTLMIKVLIKKVCLIIPIITSMYLNII